MRDIFISEINKAENVFQINDETANYLIEKKIKYYNVDNLYAVMKKNEVIILDYNMNNFDLMRNCFDEKEIDYFVIFDFKYFKKVIEHLFVKKKRLTKIKRSII